MLRPLTSRFLINASTFSQLKKPRTTSTVLSINSKIYQNEDHKKHLAHHALWFGGRQLRYITMDSRHHSSIDEEMSTF